MRAILPAMPAPAETEAKIDTPVPVDQTTGVAPAEPPNGQNRSFGRRRIVAPAPPPLPQQRSYGLITTVAALMIVTLLLAGRETVVRVWPPSAKSFAAIGLPVNLQGLELRDVRTRIVQEPTQKVLTIDGQIRNLRETSQTLPELLLSLRDANGREVYAWKAPPPKSGIARGETIQFRARLASPPEGADVVRVQFAEPAATRTASR